jgi:hypothetical protein
VDEAGRDHPARLVGVARRLRRLQRVIELREIGIGIALVHDVVEVIEHLPDGHLLSVERQVLGLLPLHEIERLVLVILAVELPDVAFRLRVVVAEVLRGLLHRCSHGSVSLT